MSAATATAVSFNDLTGTVTLGSTSSTGGTNNVSLTNVAATVNLGSGALSGASAGASNHAFLVSGGAGNVTYTGNITKANQGNVVNISGRTGGTITLSGVINGNSSNGINVSNNTSGAPVINFTGTSKSLNTGANPAVTLDNNDNATISFSGGGLAMTTTSGVGFNAINGATAINVTGSNNTITSSSAMALNVVSSTIGALGLNFQSTSAGNNTAAADPANGIVLNNTGALSGLTVAGTGTPGSGGTIQNTTGAGILLSNTQSPSFDRMNIQTTVGSGIQGTQVVNFSFTNGSISNSGTGGGTNDSNIALNAGQGSPGATNQNVSGTLTITGNTLTNAQFHGLDIYNFNGTLSAVTISNNIIQSSAVAASSQGSGIRLIADSSTTTAAHVTQATLSNNQIRNFPQGAGVLMQANSSVGGPAANLGTAGSLTNLISVTGNLISGDATDPMATQGVVAVVNRAGQGNFDISGNGTAADRIRNMAGAGLAVSAFGNVTVTANVNNNFVAPNNLFASQGIAIGLDMVDALTDAPNLTANVIGNTVSQTDGNGILTVARNSNGTLRVKIQNNNVAAPLTGVRPGIRVDSGTSAGDTAVCLNISGNTSAGSGGSQGLGLRKQGTVTTTSDFGVNGMAATSSPGVEAFISGLNPAGAGTLLISATSGFSNCSLP